MTNGGGCRNESHDTFFTVKDRATKPTSLIRTDMIANSGAPPVPSPKKAGNSRRVTCWQLGFSSLRTKNLASRRFEASRSLIRPHSVFKTNDLFCLHRMCPRQKLNSVVDQRKNLHSSRNKCSYALVYLFTALARRTGVHAPVRSGFW